MGKTLAFVSSLLLSISVFAATDLSGLYGKRTEPTIDNIKVELKKFKDSISSVNLSQQQKNALRDLEEATKVHVTPATLQRKASRGPAWRAQAIAHIEKTHDLHEAISYADEDGRASEYCEFNDDGIDGMDEYYFEWEAVKKINGSQKSIAYILNLITPFSGIDKNTGKAKLCNYPFSEYAFEAKLQNGQPAEISLD